MIRNRWLQSALATALVAVAASVSRADGPSPGPIPQTVQFNRDVRPILSDNCYFCHGFDKEKRKAGLRLDTPEGLLGKRDEGTPVVPGKPAESLLIQRITTKEKDDVMPPADHPKRLTPRDIAVLTKWVEQGGKYEGHWAYIAPKRPAVPNVNRPGFTKTDIDRFILARLEAEGISPSPQADRVTLIRRLSFDLTGLPPSPEEVQAFLADRSPEAVERVVDRLLASPQFGERMAMYWLDVVRYADTIGYHSDNPMNVSPYREWVVNAFNSNMPFDRFTTEQLAGDLIPDATTSQKVASGYNRLLQTTEEGGAQAREYLVKNFTDRVRNYSTAWLGSTMGCAQCHDHKFDPIAMRDFYTMAAFFADVQEAPIGRREAGMPVPSPKQQQEMAQMDADIAAIKAKLDTATPQLSSEQQAWEKSLATQAAKPQWISPELVTATAKGGKIARQADGVLKLSPTGGKAAANDTYTLTLRSNVSGLTAIRIETLPDDSYPGKGPGLSPNGNFVLTEAKAEVGGDGAKRKKDRTAVKFSRATADYDQSQFPSVNAIDGKKETGWGVMPEFGKNHEIVLEFEKPLVLAGDDQLTLTLDFASQFPQHQFGKFRVDVTTSPAPAGERSIPPAVRAILAVAPEKRTKANESELARFYRSIAPSLQPVRADLASAEKRKAEMLKTVPTCLVSTSGAPRVVKILHRGDWQDDKGEAVEPQIPAAFGALKVEQGKRLTRMDLAKWTVSKDNPLTSRVFVNRMWKLFYGQGLSKVLDDLGFQGEWPTHPELLDWLAADFAESGWDVKRLVRQMVLGGTYLQSSTPRAELKDRDPFNRLYARQSSFRLDAEMVRDNALAVSGLLVQKVGGPSVFPYQPPGYWFALNFPTREWQNDKGDGLHRRGLYTHWQRSFLHPSLLAFDAPSREEATCERARSNIPQQALALLNDPTYVEAARVLAGKALANANLKDDAGRIAWAFDRVINRQPTEAEQAVLMELLTKHRDEYKQDAEGAKKLLAIGDAKNPEGVDRTELAAWTSITRVLLNLSETITRY